MTDHYATHTACKGPWQHATITSQITEVQFELSYKRPQAPTWAASPLVRFTISNGPGTRGITMTGQEALKGWWALRELERDNGLAEFVTDWYTQARASLAGVAP